MSCHPPTPSGYRRRTRPCKGDAELIKSKKREMPTRSRLAYCSATTAQNCIHCKQLYDVSGAGMAIATKNVSRRMGCMLQNTTIARHSVLAPAEGAVVPRKSDNREHGIQEQKHLLVPVLCSN
jgi:hypothetical protein